MPPINCTSKWRILRNRRPASRTTAKASMRRSSMEAPCAMRSLKSMVLAARSMSDSWRIWGSRSPMAATVGSMPLISRSVLVPKIFARTSSTIMGGSPSAPILLCRREDGRWESGLALGVRPTFGCGYAALWGRLAICGRVALGLGPRTLAGHPGLRYHRSMAGSARRCTRRSVLIAGVAGARLAAQALKGNTFPSDWRRYSDPTTEMEVYRLTDPAYSSTMPAYYNRGIARSSGWMLFCCDRGGSPQAFHMDLKSGGTRQLTESEGLDGASIALLPDNRSFCYFAGRSLRIVTLVTPRERKLYEVPEGWERGVGMSVGPDGTHATFVERRGESRRLRLVALAQGTARTVVETPAEMGDPIARFRRAQILYRQAGEALWLVGSDGKQNRRLKLAAGRVGAADWAADGKTVLYLN